MAKSKGKGKNNSKKAGAGTGHGGKSGAMGKPQKGDDEEESSSGKNKPLTREGDDSKAKMAWRLQQKRLTRKVERGREMYSSYVKPKPVGPKLTGPASWVLRGAARPWTEVEAAKTRDHHAVGIDAFAAYGYSLAAEIPSAREWLVTLVEAAESKFDADDLESGVELLEEAICSDGQDLAAASTMIARETLEAEGTLVAPDGGAGALPKWAYLGFLYASPRHRFAHEDDSEPLDAALDSNPYVCWCVAYPEEFDTFVEYGEELSMHRFAPKGVLEALHVHHHLSSTLFAEKVQDRNYFAASIKRRAASHLSKLPSAAFPAEPNHPEAAMYLGMFQTAIDFIKEKNPKAYP